MTPRPDLPLLFATLLVLAAVVVCTVALVLAGGATP